MTDSPGRGLWARIDEIFTRSLELPATERNRLLREVCGDDPEVREEVERLLRAVDEAEDAGFLQRPAGVTWEPLVSRIASRREAVRGGSFGVRVGQRLGPYEIEEEIGSGGMATVYRARRADGEFDQQVALKVIRPGLAGERLIRRFVTERQILAELEHPGIARLLDGGTTDDGLPYLVMEFVEGEPITDYCDRRRLGVGERLRLFLEVADAVRHAHRNLVLHRDLKPSNILVTPQGRVKLLDFGIAKLLDPATGAGEPTLTRPGQRPLTPEYASPEQIRGEPLTTASDVYQLGGLLYRLLAGSPPYRLQATGARPLEKAIGETDPGAPSERVSGSEAADQRNDGETRRPVEDVAWRRGTTPERLRRLLRGDLDMITLKALRQEAERRYASVESLTEDIHRHLTGRPVSARPDRWSYRARKFFGRHPWLGPAAAALLLLAGVYQWTVDRHAAALERERNVARAEAVKATQMRDFLVAVFEGSDPEETLGDTVTARTLLDRGARRADSVLADQPELRADMLGVIGRIMTSLGFYDRAEPVLERAVEIRQEEYGPDDPRVARLLVDLGRAHLTSRDNSSDYRSAERRFRKALEIYRAAPAVRDSELIPALRGLGVSASRHHPNTAERHLAEAGGSLEEALEIAADVHGRESETYASLLAEQGFLLVIQGKYDEAEVVYREALARLRAVHGPRHPDIAATLRELGRLEYERGDYRASMLLVRESMDLYTEIYGRGHPRTLMAADNLARLHRTQGEVAEAVELLRENATASAKRWPEGHWRVGDRYSELGGALLRLGDDLVEAEEALRRAVEILEVEEGERHFRTLRARLRLGAVLLEQGSPEAGPWLDRTWSQFDEIALPDREQATHTLPGLIAGVAERLESVGRSEDAARWRSLSLEARAWSYVKALERGYPVAPRLEHTRSQLGELEPSELRGMAGSIHRVAERLESVGRSEDAARWRVLLPE